MLDCYASNATAAKIRSIHGTMFTRENYRELITRRTVPEAAEYLAHSPRFKEAFAEVDPNTVHRGFLEELLYRENFNTYLRLCAFQGLDKMPFYGFLIKKRELESVLSIINSVNSKLKTSSPESIPGYVIKHASINLLEISRAESYTELLKMLKGTPYYKTLVGIPQKEDGTVDYTECELRLRNAYYREVLRQVRSGFSKNEADELEEMILREIETRNIINAYRMKAFFGFSGGDIKRMSLDCGRKGKKSIEKFYELETAEDMLEWINRSVYGKNSPMSADSIETKINNVKFRYFSSKLARSISTPVVLYAFTQLCEMDVTNIVHIIEGIRYGVDPSLIESQLVAL